MDGEEGWFRGYIACARACADIISDQEQKMILDGELRKAFDGMRLEILNLQKGAEFSLEASTERVDAIQ